MGKWILSLHVKWNHTFKIKSVIHSEIPDFTPLKRGRYYFRNNVISRYRSIHNWAKAQRLNKLWFSKIFSYILMQIRLQKRYIPIQSLSRKTNANSCNASSNRQLIVGTLSMQTTQISIARSSLVYSSSSTWV